MEDLELRNESIRKKDKQDLVRLSYCAYEALEKNVYGKEFCHWLRNRLAHQMGPDINHTYHAGENDMIRTILGFIETHKRQINN